MADICVTKEGIEVAGVLQLTWDEVDAQRATFQLEDTILVKCGFRYGRYHEFEDAQIMNKDKWEKVKTALTGFTAFYSEFCGHHSSADITFWEESDISLQEITSKSEILEFFKTYGWQESNMDIISDAICQAIDNGHMDDDFNILNVDSEET